MKPATLPHAKGGQSTGMGSEHSEPFSAVVAFEREAQDSAYRHRPAVFDYGGESPAVDRRNRSAFENLCRRGSRLGIAHVAQLGDGEFDFDPSAYAICQSTAGIGWRVLFGHGQLAD